MNTTDSTKRFEAELSKIGDSIARKRLAMLFDNETYTELDRFVKNNGEACEVVTAYGEVNGMLVYAYSQSIDVNNGAMGMAQASKIAHIYELATKTGAPVVAVFDSNGAHLDEGTFALEAYGSVIKAASNVSGVVPQIAVVAGACIGSASVLASLSDFVIMTDAAELYITPACAKNNSFAKIAAQNGTASLLAEDDVAAMKMVAELLSYLPSNNLSEPLFAEYVAANGSSAIDSVVDAESFFEVFADYGACVKVGFARVGGASVGIVATDSSVNDGYFCENGAKKAAKFVRICDAFSIPVVTLVDSKGIKTDNAADGEDVKSVAILTSAYSEATTAKIAIVTGNAIGGAYISFVSSAGAPDLVYAYADSTIGVLEPMTAVQLLYKDRLTAGEDRKALENEYASEKCSPFCAAAVGLVNDVISPEDASSKIISALDVLSSKRVSTLSKKHTNIPL